MTLLLLKSFLLVALLYISVSRAQIDLYSTGEFTTVAPNATVCSSTNILGDINQGVPLNFSWTIDSLNYVNWTWQGLFYPVLGSIQCPRGQGLVYEGVWRCNTNVAQTSDRLAALSCPPSANEPTFGANGTVYCDPDNDTLAGFICPAGAILRSNGATWFCSTDGNLLGGLTGCMAGDVLRFVNGAWACSQAFNDSDTLRGLIPNCTNNYIPKYIGDIWVCALDNDVLRYLNCAPEARVQRSANGATWVCGPKEQDTFRDITINCTGNRDTPFFTADGWDCRPTPAINNSLLLGTLLYEWSVSLQSSGDVVTSPSSQYQTYLLPYAGQIRGFQLKVSPLGLANMTAIFSVNAVPAYTTTFFGSTTRVVGSSDFAIPFERNTNISFALTSAGPGGGYINLGVYAQVLAA